MAIRPEQHSCSAEPWNGPAVPSGSSIITYWRELNWYHIHSLSFYWKIPIIAIFPSVFLTLLKLFICHLVTQLFSLDETNKWYSIFFSAVHFKEFLIRIIYLMLFSSFTRLISPVFFPPQYFQYGSGLAGKASWFLSQVIVTFKKKTYFTYS